MNSRMARAGLSGNSSAEDEPPLFESLAFVSMRRSSTPAYIDIEMKEAARSAAEETNRGFQVTYHASAIWTSPGATLQQRQSGRHRLGRRRRDEGAAESSDSETNYERPDCKSLLSAASVSVAPKNLPTQLLGNGHLPQKFFESGAPTSRSDSGTPAARLHIVLQNLTSGQLQLGTNLLTSPVQQRAKASSLTEKRARGAVQHQPEAQTAPACPPLTQPPRREVKHQQSQVPTCRCATITYLQPASSSTSQEGGVKTEALTHRQGRG